MGAGRWTEVVDRRAFDGFLTYLGTVDRPPVIATTFEEGSDRPGVEIEALAEKVADVADIYLLSPQSTFWLTDSLGDKTLSVHSGWTRLYPSSQGWRTKAWLAPSFRPDPEGQLGRIDRIVEAALDAAFRGGQSQRPAPVIEGEPVTAVVRGLLSPTQVLVQAPGRGQAIMRSRHLYPGLPAERLVSKGQHFDGRWSSVGAMGEFVPDPSRTTCRSGSKSSSATG